MEPVLKYILEMVVCSGIFLLVYSILPKKSGGYVRLRAFILVSIVLSAILPLVEIPVYPSGKAEYKVAVQEESVDGDADVGMYPVYGGSDVAVNKTESQGLLNAGYLLYGTAAVYSVVVAVLAYGMAARLLRIRRQRRRSSLQVERKGNLVYTVAESGDIVSPFSFLRTIYIGSNMKGEERNMVIEHECSHIRHRHSEERLFMSAMQTIFWFNPFVWIFGRKLGEIQEFEADRDVLSEGYDVRLYRLTILKQLFGYCPEISCGLKNSLTKRRFIMMTEKSSTRFAAVRWIAATVLMAGTVFLSGATTVSDPADLQPELKDNPELSGLAEQTGGPDLKTAADTLVIEVSDKGRSIMLNGNLTAGTEALSGDISSVKADLVVIKAEKDTPMGVIADIKQVLRKSGNLRLVYGTADPTDNAPDKTKDMPVKYLPPMSTDNVKVIEPEYMSVGKDDIVLVRVDGKGEVSIVYKDTRITAAGNRRYADEIADMIGSNHALFVSLEADAETDYAVYTYVISQIDEAYALARDKYALEKFGKPFGSLGKELQSTVKREIPKRVAEPSRFN